MSAPPGASWAAATTASWFPRATGRGSTTTRSGPTSARKQTSRPPARSISRRMCSAACASRRRGWRPWEGTTGRGAADPSAPSNPASTAAGRIGGAVVSRGELPGDRVGSRLPPRLELTSGAASRLERLFLRSGEKNVVENQPVAGRIGVERQIGRLVTDLVLRIFRVVPT